MNNKGADQTARMRRMVCACVVGNPPKTVFLALRPIFDGSNLKIFVFLFFLYWDTRKITALKQIVDEQQ